MNIDNLTRDELLELQEVVKAKLKTFKPFRIKEIYKTCGVANCYCQDGEVLHGPYLYILYRENKKTKQVSLGRKRSFDELKQLVFTPYPEIKDYFPVTPEKYEKLSPDEKSTLYKYELSDYQFEKRYGFSRENDKIGMYGHFYGTGEAYDKYFIDCDLVDQTRLIPCSYWAENYGVGTLRGLAIISTLESKGYYFKEGG